MKLIEKLAKDYYQERPEGFGEPTEDFKAGFRKARELAVDLVDHGRNCERGGQCPACDISQIGEEEVK